MEGIPGYQGVQLLRKDHQEETEFISMIWFDHLENVKDFVGENFDIAHVPGECRALLKRFEERVEHYDVKHRSSIK